VNSLPLTRPVGIAVDQLDHVTAFERRKRLLAPTWFGNVLKDPHGFGPSVRPVRPQVQIDKQVTIGREVECLLAPLQFTLLLDGAVSRETLSPFPCLSVAVQPVATAFSATAKSVLSGIVLARPAASLSCANAMLSPAWWQYAANLVVNSRSLSPNPRSSTSEPKVQC
jgi:hypothetical protein